MAARCSYWWVCVEVVLCMFNVIYTHAAFVCCVVVTDSSYIFCGFSRFLILSCVAATHVVVVTLRFDSGSQSFPAWFISHTSADGDVIGQPAIGFIPLTANRKTLELRDVTSALLRQWRGGGARELVMSPAAAVLWDSASGLFARSWITFIIWSFVRSAVSCDFWLGNTNASGFFIRICFL